MLTLGIVHSTIRGDEKLIYAAAKKRNIRVELVDVREQILNIQVYKAHYDIALERCISTVKGMHFTRFLEAMDIAVINSSAVASICEDKFLTSLTLRRFKVPTVDFAMVFTLDAAVAAIVAMGGFPVVIKPTLGSWGRLLAKVNDRDSLETVLEHKEVLGTPPQKAIYIQKYVEKRDRDIRAFVVEGKTICAIVRHSKHWITNTARGGVASNYKVTKELSDLCRKASQAVGGGLLAMDVFETVEGLKINEINHTMEFKNSEGPTGVSISGAIVDYCIKQAQKK